MESLPMIRQPKSPEPRAWTAVDIIDRLGDVPLYRVRTKPAPGTATEDDLLQVNDRVEKGAICELIDGTLVEKDMGAYESYLASALANLISNFASPRKLGVVLGESGPYRLPSVGVRVPDVSFVSSSRFSAAQLRREAVLTLAPDLAVEVVSRGNTMQELDRKLRDYFDAGVLLVWYIYPAERLVHVFTSKSDCRVLTDKDTLEGGLVLPGFQHSVAKLYFELEQQLGHAEG